MIQNYPHRCYLATNDGQVTFGSQDLSSRKSFSPFEWFPYLYNEKSGCVSKGAFAKGSVKLTTSASSIFDHNAI